MTRACERLWEVDALREGRLSARDSESLARHRDVCDECRQRFADDEKLRALGRALPPRAVDALHARRLRQAILRTAAVGDGRPRLRARWYLAVAVAAVVVAGWAFRSRFSAVAPHPVATLARPFGATIDAEPGATWSARTEGLTERVRLTAGAITLRVRHRDAGERFIVELPDGAIEVRGTHFRVDVAERVTRAVHVIEGLVALRRTGAEEVLLTTNESWQLPDPGPTAGSRMVSPIAAPSAAGASAASASGRAPLGAPSALPSARASRALPAASARETSEYESAVELFAARRYDEAAPRLHAFAIAHSDRVEAEDAAFLEASALAHVGRVDAAAVVAEHFLDRFPSSLHAPDAAVLAIRAARDRGDCARARLLASRWLTDPRVRAVALGECG